MEELLAAAAEAMGAPISMVERSAEARAKAKGTTIEEVLRAWAGGGEIVAATAAPPVAEPEAVETKAAAEPATPAASSPPAMDEASIVAAAAEKMGMPESMVKRSAAARAKAQGVDVDTVLMEWAGVEGAAAAPAVVAPAAATPAASSPPAMDEASIVAAAAEKMGMPESMVKRSAAARAKAQGVDVDTVLMEWAGVEGVAAASTATPAPLPAATSVAAVPAPVEESQTPESTDEMVPSAPVDPVDPFESEEEAAAAGALPRWLAALFVFVPAFAIAYALFLPNGPNCGDAGSLAVDPVTGLAVNCDGSAFGSEFVDLFTLGAETYNGIGCVACHGPSGGGVGTFPAFIGGALLTTFPTDSCSAQIDWIALGTTGWPDATYGANEKPVGGSGAVMPGFAATLSVQELAAVAVYERVSFGGQDLDAALLDCGVSETDAATPGE